jgi:hypothetical protein
MTSPDGITWTLQTSAANYQWFNVNWSPELGIFVAVAFSGTGDRVTGATGSTGSTGSTGATGTFGLIGTCWA